MAVKNILGQKYETRNMERVAFGMLLKIACLNHATIYIVSDF